MINSYKFKKQPWNPQVATESIHQLAKLDYDLLPTEHFKQRLLERDLVIGDVRYLLKNGWVYEEPEKASSGGFFKYQIEGLTPNSNGRKVRAILIPDEKNKKIKIVTIIWVDE